MLISDAYRELNRQLLATGWGASADLWVDRVHQLRSKIGGDVLDYGCGQGVLGIGRQYDPCVHGKDGEPEPAELVCCIDVLEHVEPEFLDAVLEHIASLTKDTAFLVISTQPAVAVLPDGRNAHLTVQTAPWWRERIGKHFAEVQVEHDDGVSFSCTAKPTRHKIDLNLRCFQCKVFAYIDMFYGEYGPSGYCCSMCVKRLFKEAYAAA